ncbi:MAG: thioredoxin domain-containing protein, partial [Anaerolineales bacterium]
MPNKLIQETSPYLLQHADNPVDWFPWGEQPFEIARQEDKPVFLSIGYAACHWCHVMAHESFEDPQTAEFMNAHFINIKVDREERPDIDSIYMDAVVSLNGQGGWPLSVFLTPEGKPFFGGTYFPPQRRFNMPSFREVLESIQDEWTSNRERIEQVSEQLSRHLQARPNLPTTDGQLDMATLDKATEQLFKDYDWKYGGWGSAPKFPQAAVVEFLLQRYHRKKDRLALDMSTHALRSMARGGLFDQIGGGFHRYSVDERWLVPHFEKMLYDNAVLLPAYLHAWQITGDTEFIDTVHKTIEFLLREMRGEEGAFYASLDADTEGQEGSFYIWTVEELQQAISDEGDLQLALDYYGFGNGPNFEGANVLHRPVTTAEFAKDAGMSLDDLRARLAVIDSALLEARSERIHPAADDKIITAWNGLLLIALAETARVLDHRQYQQVAKQLGRFLVSHLKTADGWKRTWRQGRSKHPATLRDLAAAGLGFLALYELDFNPDWFFEAEELTAEILQNYRDTDGGFYDTHINRTDLISRPK